MEDAVVRKKPNVRPPAFAPRSPVGALREGSPTHKGKYKANEQPVPLSHV